MRQTATLRYLRIAPRKMRLVSNLIRGLSVNEAEAQLLFERRRPARPLLKLLRSAVQAAKNAKHFDLGKLYVESIRVDQGPMLKRHLPRARGVATPIHKKASHVTLVLAESNVLKPPRFTIVVPKKAKLPPAERGKKKKEVRQPTEPAAQIKKPGFFRRMFSRKSV